MKFIHLHKYYFRIKVALNYYLFYSIQRIFIIFMHNTIRIIDTSTEEVQDLMNTNDSLTKHIQLIFVLELFAREKQNLFNALCPLYGYMLCCYCLLQRKLTENQSLFKDYIENFNINDWRNI